MKKEIMAVVNKLGYNLGIYYYHVAEFAELIKNSDKDPDRLKAYENDVIAGAQTAAAGILTAMQELAAEPLLMQKIIGNKSTHHMYAMGQLSTFVKATITEDTYVPILHPELLAVLGHIAGVIGADGFSCFNQRQAEWLLEGYALRIEKEVVM